MKFFASLAEFTAINKQKGSKAPLIAFSHDGHRANSLRQPTFTRGWQKPSRSIIFFHGAIKNASRSHNHSFQRYFNIALVLAGPSSLEPPKKARPGALFPRPASVLCLDVLSVPFFGYVYIRATSSFEHSVLTAFLSAYFRSWRNELVLLTSQRSAQRRHHRRRCHFVRGI